MTSKSKSSATTSNAVAEASAGANNTALTLPDFMRGDDQGKDSIDSSDLIIPRVALMQGISPAVMAGNAENGEFYHTINEVGMGILLQVVPILHRRQWTLWRPLHQGGGVIARASDGAHWDNDFDVEVAPYKDFPKKVVRYSAKAGDVVSRDVGLGKWGSADPENPDSGPAATLSHILLMCSLEHIDMGPFVVFLQKSSERAAKMLLTKIKMDTQTPIYGQVYKMSGTQAQNNAGQEYNQYAFQRDGWVPSEELYLKFKEMHEMYKTTQFRTNDDDAQTEGGDAPAGGAGGSTADSENDSY